MLSSSQSDEDLMTAYQNGSDEAFRLLYDRHSGKVFGYLMRRTRSEQLAGDLAQEVFIKLHKSKHLYNKSLPALPWIFSITNSVLIDGFRKSAKTKEVLSLDLDQFSSPGGETFERFDSLTPMLSQLPNAQRSALEMRYLEEKTFDEIAVRLQTSPLNVRQIISRAIKQLKKTKGESRT